MSGLMQPETARHAWERGFDDARRYHEYADTLAWKALTGSDPTEKDYAEQTFGPLARDWQAGWDAACAPAGTVATCGCEHESHMVTDEREVHAYGAAPAGEHRAQHVGRVCDGCAETCMKDHLITKEGAA